MTSFRPGLPFSEEVEGCEVVPGETRPRRSMFGRKQLVEHVEETTRFKWKTDAKGPFEVFTHACDLYPDLNAFGRFAGDGFDFMTFKDAKVQIIKIADGCRKLLGVGKGQSLGLFSKNRLEWSLTNFAVNGIGGVSVPIYDTAEPSTISFIINHSAISAILLTSNLADRLLAIQEVCPSMKKLVVMDDDDPAAVSSVKKKFPDLQVFAFQELVDAGSPSAEFEPTSREAMGQIMYTSGTTGEPKGVILTNRNFVAEIATLRITEDFFDLSMEPGDGCISYLPNAHIFAQALEITLSSLGMCIYFTSGNVKNFLKEMQAINPHCLPSVPRILTRFEDTVKSKVAASSRTKRLLFHAAFRIQSFCFFRLHFRIPLLDSLVFNKIRDALFSNMKLMFCGSAPLSRKTQSFLNIVFNCPVIQGFGMTETCAAVAATHPVYGLPGSIGGPLPNTLFKLKDCVECGYAVADLPNPRGELLMKGSTISPGYYKNDEATKKEFTEDGWFSSGDIAQLNADGSLSIIDRKKNIFKLAQAEYVAVEQVESVFGRCSYLAQIWVYGDSSKAALVAVGVPSKIETFEWASEMNIGGDLDDICKTPEYTERVLKDLESLRAEHNLKGYERIKKIHFETDVDELGQGFTTETGLATPSMKLKRPQLKRKYQKQIDVMYAELGQ
ncbi:hypothetical protein NDN08_002393 [Rhodosorus marinus]|uniref:AMP-dependent synthetase/ligase domain-containing protein n=1 Tax=Rhodosorus marinus TaxID=101924 RepID=A0AAV8UTK9_9RHOD|nr:hypothetical protein NDN08_002393 [Rhodosorus marinus]